MPSFVLDVFGAKRMSVIYGAVLTAWAAAGIFGPLYVGYLKDQYPDRAVTYGDVPPNVEKCEIGIV